MENSIVDLLDTLGDLHRACGEFLLAEAETARELLDIAATTTGVDAARREIRSACGSLDTINRFLGRLRLYPGLRQAVEQARDKLRSRITAVECRKSDR